MSRQHLDPRSRHCSCCVAGRLHDSRYALGSCQEERPSRYGIETAVDIDPVFLGMTFPRNRRCRSHPQRPKRTRSKSLDLIVGQFQSIAKHRDDRPLIVATLKGRLNTFDGPGRIFQTEARKG